MAVGIGFKIFILLFVNSVSVIDVFENRNRFAIKISKTYKEEIKEILEEYNFIWIFQVTPGTFIVDFTINNGRGGDVLESLSLKYPDKLLWWERMRIYENTIKPAFVPDRRILQPDPGDTKEHFYGMGVEDAWRLGFTGKGITIAIADVGIDVDLLDLTKNANNGLGLNFVKNNDNVAPETFPGNQVLASNLTDHGNSVASIIAAEYGNNICSDGIAYNSTIAAFKVFDVKLNGNKFYLEPIYLTNSDIIARALVYKLNDIDIFVSAWYPTTQFDHLDLLVSETIHHVAMKGRNKLGTIHLVPAGPVGNGLSNNMYTITVGSVGQYGTVPYYAYIDASVITSGLSDGSSLYADMMFTTSHGSTCTNGFKGLSAATAHIAGIIALGLEANPHLTLRDVQHLLILASEHEGLKESSSFRQNGIGRYVHGIFGYGLLNATKFTIFAEQKKTLPRLLNTTLQMKKEKNGSPYTEEFNVCFDCPEAKTEDCLTSVEHVVVSTSLKTSTRILKMEIISPAGTMSVLMDEKYENQEERAMEVELLSTHFWDEISIGVWRVVIQHNFAYDVLQIDNIYMTITGTFRTNHDGFLNKSICTDVSDTIEQSVLPNKTDSENILEHTSVSQHLHIDGVLMAVTCLIGLCFNCTIYVKAWDMLHILF